MPGEKRPVLKDIVTIPKSNEDYRLLGRKMIQTLVGVAALLIGMLMVDKMGIDNSIYEIFAKYVTVLVIAFGTANAGITIASILKNGGKK